MLKSQREIECGLKWPNSQAAWTTRIAHRSSSADTFKIFPRVLFRIGSNSLADTVKWNAPNTCGRDIVVAVYASDGMNVFCLFSAAFCSWPRENARRRCISISCVRRFRMLIESNVREVRPCIPRTEASPFTQTIERVNGEPSWRRAVLAWQLQGISH